MAREREIRKKQKRREVEKPSAPGGEEREEGPGSRR